MRWSRHSWIRLEIKNPPPEFSLSIEPFSMMASNLDVTYVTIREKRGHTGSMEKCEVVAHTAIFRLYRY
jgi:hypothetical protein